MPLLYEKRGHVAVLTLSRPQARNTWGEDYNEAPKEIKLPFAAGRGGIGDFTPS